VLFQAAKGDKIIRFYTPLSIIFLRDPGFETILLPIFTTTSRCFPFAVELKNPLLAAQGFVILSLNIK
jgi:hypothetical protein